MGKMTEKRVRKEMKAEERGTGRLPVPASIFGVLPEYRNETTLEQRIDALRCTIEDLSATIHEMKTAPTEGIPDWAVQDVIRHSEEQLAEASKELGLLLLEDLKQKLQNERKENDNG